MASAIAVPLLEFVIQTFTMLQPYVESASVAAAASVPLPFIASPQICSMYRNVPAPTAVIFAFIASVEIIPTIFAAASSTIL